MREILFRGKDKDNNWIYGYFNRFTNYKYDVYPAIIPILNNKSGSMSDLVGIKEETVGQYTGLTDKNGEKIFEGDILLCYGTQKVVVSFKNGQYVISHYALNLLWGRSQDCEVIGNVYDNPELLEVEE